MADPTTIDGRPVTAGAAQPVEIMNAKLPEAAGGTPTNPYYAESPYKMNGQEIHRKITCTLANTDYAALDVIPAGCARILVYAATYDAILGTIATTTAANGMYLHADTVYELRVTAGDTLHAQSATAGTVVYISYLFS